MEVNVVDFRKDVKNTRQGYFTLLLDGVAIKQCVLHKHPAGKVWFAPPAVQVSEGRYTNVVQLDGDLNAKAQERVAQLLAPRLA